MNYPQTNEKIITYWAILAKYDSRCFGNYCGENREEALAKMADDVGESGVVADWNIVERLIVDTELHIVTVYENGAPLDAGELVEILEQCGFVDADFDATQRKPSPDGEGYVFSFTLNKDREIS